MITEIGRLLGDIFNLHGITLCFIGIMIGYLIPRCSFITIVISIKSHSNRLVFLDERIS